MPCVLVMPLSLPYFDFELPLTFHCLCLPIEYSCTQSKSFTELPIYIIGDTAISDIHQWYCEHLLPNIAAIMLRRTAIAILYHSITRSTNQSLKMHGVRRWRCYSAVYNLWSWFVRVNNSPCSVHRDQVRSHSRTKSKKKKRRAVDKEITRYPHQIQRQCPQNPQ